ncbi:MAG: response regulator [Candidatus Latescibacteria bacterium]|nr:response regulator [Candidatus Latescibacterota bacterium]
MPEEKEQAPNEGQKPSLDQETLDQMLAESQGDADQLESMLNSLEDNTETETETAPAAEGDADLSELTDDMEAMLERMESDEPDEPGEPDEDTDVSDLNDMLYQATLADVEQTQPDADEGVLDLDDAVASVDAEEGEDAADALLAEANDISDDADEAMDDLLESADTVDDDALSAMLEDVEDEVPDDVAALEADDLDAMLDESETETEADGLDALLEEVEEDEAAELEASDEGLDTALEGAETGTGEALETALEDEEITDLDALLEDTEEPEGEDDLESLDDADLDALLEDVEDGAEELVAEADADMESLDDTDLDALLEGETETDEASDTSSGNDAETEALADEDLDALLEDVDDEVAEETTDVIEDTGLDALLEDSETEETSDEDVEALLEDAEEPAAEDAVESLDDTDLDALLEDAEDEVGADALADDDLEELLEDTEATLDDELDALLEDVEDVSDEDAFETIDDSDLDAMLEDVEEDSTEDDLDALLEDAADEDAFETIDDSDLDAMLEDVEEDIEEEVTVDDDLDDLLDDIETGLSDDMDDLDDLLGDNDAANVFDDDLDDLLDDFETEDGPLNVGVEDEVAQILATGESLSGDDSILDEFKSVQESIITSPLSSDDMSDDGTLLMIDGDPDQRSLFEDALDGKYDFAEANTLTEALQTLHNEHVDLILLSLDDDDGGALEFIEQVNASLDMPAIPIIVASEDTERIEHALRLGAVDYITRPLDVMDIEFQVPQKVRNQMKLKKAERILAGASETVSFESDAPQVDDFGMEEDSEADLDDLLDDDFLLEDDAAPEDLLVRPSSKKEPLRPLSDQQKILRNRQAAKRDISRIPLFALIVAFLAATVGGVYHYADELKELLPMNTETIATAPPRPKQPLPKVKMPTVPTQNYASSSMPTPPPARANVYQQQADVLKSRIEKNVRELADNGGAWWSPWRVMRASGASVSGLVDRQSVDGILGAFGVDMATVERDLQSQRTLDYLAGVGFDLRGKNASDLSAREAFELLSARQIKNADQIVGVLSKLTDGLAAERTAQEEHKEKERRKRKGQAMLVKPHQNQIHVAQMAVVTTPLLAARHNDVVQIRNGDGHLFRVKWPEVKHRV